MVALIVMVIIVTCLILVVSAYFVEPKLFVRVANRRTIRAGKSFCGCLLFTVVAVVVGSIFCQLYFRSLKELRRAMQKVAEGDLT